MEASDHDYGCPLVNAETEHQNLHITVQKGRSLPSVKKCSCCPSPQYHCPFCGPGFFKPTKLSKIKIHMDGHFNKAVSYGDYTIHRCGLRCRNRQHFHCLYCTATVLRKRDLKVHLSFCHTKHTQTTSVRMSNSSVPAQDPNLTLSPEDSKPIASAQGSNPKPAHCTKLEEVLPLWLNNTRLCTILRDPRVHTCSEQAFKLNPLHSPDPLGACVKEKMAKDHDYGSNLAETEPKENKLHITIQKGRSLPPVQKCCCCPSPQYHCPFCGLGFFKPTKLSKLKIHLRGHIKKAIPHGDYTIHRCGLSCRKQQHFHCLYCTATVLRKRDLKAHLSCHVKHLRTTPTSDQGPNSSLALVQSFEMPTQTLSPTSPAQIPNPITSIQGPTPTVFSPTSTKLACSTKLEEVLPLRLNKTVTFTLPQDPVVKKCSKLPSMVKPHCSPDLGGACVKANQMKMEAKDHDYDSNLVDAEIEENKLHVTVQKGRSLPSVKKCTCCPSPQYHCPFCGPRFFKPTKLSKTKIHLNGHFNKAVSFKDYTIHRCGLSCRKQQHFHCLYCTATVLRKRDLKAHLSCHIKHTRILSDQGPSTFSPPLEPSFETPEKEPSPKTIAQTPSHIPFT